MVLEHGLLSNEQQEYGLTPHSPLWTLLRARDTKADYSFGSSLMGIQGLLPFIKPCLSNTHIGDYAGKRVAVDAYVWLHRGVLTCASELCQNIPTDR